MAGFDFCQEAACHKLEALLIFQAVQWMPLPPVKNLQDFVAVCLRCIQLVNKRDQQ